MFPLFDITSTLFIPYAVPCCAMLAGTKLEAENTKLESRNIKRMVVRTRMKEIEGLLGKMRKEASDVRMKLREIKKRSSS